MSTHRLPTRTGFRRQRILPVILCNLILLMILVAAVSAGLLFYVQNMLNNKVRFSEVAAADQAANIDAFLTAGCDRAAQYAVLLSQSGSVADASSGRQAMLDLFCALENGADVCLADREGQWLSQRFRPTNVQDQPFFSEALAGRPSASIVDSGGVRYLVFAAPITQGSFTQGLVCIAADTATFDQTLPVDPPLCDACVLLDDSNVPLASSGASAASFRYDAIAQNDILLKPNGSLRILPLIRSGRFHLDDRLSAFVDETSALTDAQVRTIVNSDAYLTLGLWFEQPLAHNGWRIVTHTVQQLDAFSMRELLVVLVAALLVVCVPVLFSVAITISSILHNRRVAKALLYDPITGGNNFEHFKLEAAKALKRRRNNGKVLSMVSLDINRFRVFSEVHGQEAGEALLVRMCRSLGKALRRGELIARCNADEFALLLILAPSEDPLARVGQITAGLNRLYPEERIRYSTGVYVVNDRSLPVQRMYTFATVARDAARISASSAPMLFDNAMRSQLLDEQQIESLMDKALKNREFSVYLQPKYSVQEHKLSGAEALVRWISPERGFVSPGAFIPLFERNGFILKLDDYMLRGVCALQKRWMDAGNNLVPISVNVSRANFSRGNVAQRIKSIVDEYGIPYSCVELELTESAFFDDQLVLINTVRQLRDFGFSVSMDDFGSGYSSLNSLKNLPLDVVKLDKAFFDDATDVERGITLIRDTIALAKHLDMKVVAEGIETREQVEFLMGTRCDLIQGFYFAKPMPVEEFEKLS